MNYEMMKAHLREAHGALANLIAGVDGMSEGRFKVELRHIYHHLNWAWNTRNQTWEEADGGDETQTRRLEQFPRGAMRW